MSDYQTFSNVNMRDKITSNVVRNFEEEQNFAKRNRPFYSQIGNSIPQSQITSYHQEPLVMTTITTKHYPTDAEQRTGNLDQQKKREGQMQHAQYQKLVEKHQKQQGLLKLKEQQQQSHRQQQLEQDQRKMQLKKQHDNQLREQKDYLKQLQRGGIRMTGIYPPEYFENQVNDESPDTDDGVDYYLPPPLEFSSSSKSNSAAIAPIPPPEHYDPSIQTSQKNQDYKPSPILKKDNTNIKLFVTTATFSPTKNLTNIIAKPIQDDASAQINIPEPLPSEELNELFPTSRDHMRSEETHENLKSSKNYVGLDADRMTSKTKNIGNSINSDSSKDRKTVRSESTATKRQEIANVKVVAVDKKGNSNRNTTKTTGRTEIIASSNGPNTKATPAPPITVRRSTDKKGSLDGTKLVGNNATKTNKIKDALSSDKAALKNVSVEVRSGNSGGNSPSTQRQQSDAIVIEPNKENIKSNQENTYAPSATLSETGSKAQQSLSSGGSSRKSIEIRKDFKTPELTTISRSNSIKYKLDNRPTITNTDTISTSPGFRLPTPELKIHYVSKSPRSSSSDPPSGSESPKKNKSSLETPKRSKKALLYPEQRNGEGKHSAGRVSNAQKILNLFNVKSSPTLSFKFHRNKNEEKSRSEGRKARKKSVDILGNDSKTEPQHPSTPPPKPKGQFEVTSEQSGTSETAQTKRPQKLFDNDAKQSAELMAVEMNADGVPIKHLVLTPSSKYPQSNECSRAGSPTPRHSRQNSDGSAVFASDAMATLNKPSSPPPPHFVIVAIDFGTTYSGYAFSFVRDPDSLHIMRRWEGGDPGLVNQKTLTTLLLDPSGKFHSFGFSARDSYHDLDQEEARRWLYFEKFKMTLHHNAELNKDTIIKASNGKPYSALKVFSYALKYFKDHALQELTDQSETTIYNEDIRWIITVPAIWKAPAKQFMRQAAYQAGLATTEHPNQLLIALEPEAASIYVRKLRVYQLVPDSSWLSSSLSISTHSADTTPWKRESTPEQVSGNGIYKGNVFKDEKVKYQTFPSANKLLATPSASSVTVGQEVDIDGTRYMVVDCGGGTVDITVHEMEANGGSLRELHKATGGPYGSIGIDHEFEKLLVSIFGPEFMDSYKLKRPAGWIDLMTAFESRKRSAHPDKQNSLNIALPFSLIEFYKKNKGSSVESAIRKFGNKEITWSAQGMLRLTPGAMKKLFQSTLDRIKQAIGDVLNHPDARGIKYLFLVGGFAESGILQSDIKREFGQLLKIIIPQDVGTTILKGAVCFGLDPTVVSVRKCRMTYGVGVLNKFIDDVHPLSKLVVKDGVRWCTDVLDKFVVTDQPVALGDTVVRSYAPARAGQRSSVIHIYCSERSDAMLVTDPGVKRCGTLCLDTTESQYRQLPSGAPLAKSRRAREIQARMTFGDTEIKVTAVDVATGKCVRSTIDFLGR